MLRPSVALVLVLPLLGAGGGPADGSFDHYDWHPGPLAMHQVGMRHWEAWQEALPGAVGTTQRRDGDFRSHKGSRDPIGPWGVEGGRVHGTAVLATSLCAYGHYARVFPAGD